MGEAPFSCILYAIAYYLFLACGKTQKIKNSVSKNIIIIISKCSPVYGGVLTATNRHLRLNTSNGDTVWVLLTRHQVSTHRKSDYVALHVSEDQDHRMDTSKIVATVSAS